MAHGRLTTVAQSLWGQVLRPGDTAVDATCGNGHDTAFLAAAVGPGGTVHAFDVQQAAIGAARQRLASSVAAAAIPALHFHLQSHADMRRHVADGSARLVVFNLGAPCSGLLLFGGGPAGGGPAVLPCMHQRNVTCMAATAAGAGWLECRL